MTGQRRWRVAWVGGPTARCQRQPRPARRTPRGAAAVSANAVLISTRRRAQEQPVNLAHVLEGELIGPQVPVQCEAGVAAELLAPTSRRGSMPHDRSRDVDGVPDTADRVAGVFLGQRVLLLTVAPWRVNLPAQPCCVWLALADLFTSVDDGSSALLGRVEDQGPVPVFPHRAGPSL
jgi:hypothetical protein